MLGKDRGVMSKDEKVWGRMKKITPKSAKDFKPGKASYIPSCILLFPLG